MLYLYNNRNLWYIIIATQYRYVVYVEKDVSLSCHTTYCMNCVATIAGCVFYCVVLQKATHFIYAENLKENKIMKKRMVSYFIILCMILISSSATVVNATQDRSYNFSKSYTLTGNYASDIVAVANAQIGKTKSSLGYTEAWCADFTTDCARLTGMPDTIVPYNYSSRGAVSSLYSYMTNYCNAQVVSNRQAGDFVFYYCPKCNSYPHVGIVRDGTYSVEGNVNGQVYLIGGSNGQYIDSNGHKVSDGTVQRIYVRPAYGNGSSSGGTTSSPTGAWMWTSKSIAAVGEEISFNYNATGATGFVLGIDKIGVGRVRTVDVGSSDWYTTTFSEAGTYTIYATCYNSAGGIDSNSISFTIYDFPPTGAWIWADKNIAAVGEEISFNYNATDATGFVLGINKTNIGRVRTVDVGSSDWYTTTFSEAGTYTIYATCYNPVGGMDSSSISFTIYDSPPTDAWITSNKSSVAIGEKISFSYNATNATSFVLGIDKNNVRIRTLDAGSDTSYITSFSEAGNYSVYATCYNSIGGIDSNKITFTVYDSKSTPTPTATPTPRPTPTPTPLPMNFSVTMYSGYAEVQNNGTEAQEATIIIADYDSGVLKNINTAKITFAAGEKMSFMCSKSAKVFVWDSLSGMKPLAKD